MLFYQSIHPYYDSIFPLNYHQIEFIKHEFNGSGKKLLDIGCATGNLSLELAKIGFHVDAIDLDGAMIDWAKSKVEKLSPVFKQGDMLQLDKYYLKESFDGIICFGNTLVHLTTKEQINRFIALSKSLLKNGGKILIQILNYDYILNKGLCELPLIENSKVRFERTYKFQTNNLIRFNTKLNSKDENITFENSVELYPLTSNEVFQLLSENGFMNIEIFGGFNRKPIDTNDLPFIIKAEKDG